MTELTGEPFETAKEVETGPEGVVKRWKMEWEIADDVEENWRNMAREAISEFRPEGGDETKFNILHSNTQTLAPALYQNTPRPDVRRRFKDEDPVGKAVAKLTERGLAFSLDSPGDDFDTEARAAVIDYLLTGRGVVRERYVPTFSKGNAPLQHVSADTQEAEPQVDEMGQPVPQDPDLVYEESVTERVKWDDFSMLPCRSWKECRAIRFKHRMTREELIEAFPDVGADVDLDWTPDSLKDENDVEDAFQRAEVWEIWDKVEKKVLFIAKSYDKAPLKEEDDPLNLQEFYPVPKPIYSIPTVDSMVPYPEYEIYKDQADELNEVTQRIRKLNSYLKVVGIYDAVSEDVGRILEADDGDMIPSSSFAQFAQAGGIAQAVQFLPIKEIADVLAQLYINRDQIKQTIYEITGISDIFRGASDPNETLGAQQIKTQFGSLRLENRQKDVQRFLRDTLRIKAEIMLERFAPQTLQMMTGLPVTPEMQQIMSTDGPRGFRIDIETDSTIKVDQQGEQEAITQLLSAVVEFVNGIGPAVASGAIPLEAAKALLMLAVRRFRDSREVEDALNQIENQPQQPRGPTPEQIQAQKDEQQAQMDAQVKHAEMQMKAQEDKAKMQQEGEKAQAEEARFNLEMNFKREQAELERDLKRELAKDARKHEAREAGIADEDEISGLTEAAQAIIQALEANTQGQAQQAEEMRQSFAMMMEALMAPVVPIRDRTGKLTGAQRVIN